MIITLTKQEMLTLIEAVKDGIRDREGLADCYKIRWEDPQPPEHYRALKEVASYEKVLKKLRATSLKRRGRKMLT